MRERELMTVRSDLGMVFQEGALFDSLTVAENVGYKLFEETDLPVDEVRTRVESARLRPARGIHRPASVRVVGRSATSRRHRPGNGCKAGHPLYDEATTGLDPITATTIDEEMVKLRDLEG